MVNELGSHIRNEAASLRLAGLPRTSYWSAGDIRGRPLPRAHASTAPPQRPFISMETLVIELRLNDRELDVTTVEKLGAALDVVDAEEAFELRASAPTGPAILMLRNGSSAWLMYLREPGDSGFRSSGNESRRGVAAYRLSNGQVDEYPLSWCIDVEQCYKAIAYFCVNGGEKAEWVDWIPS
jgi:hypothetical protein